MGVPWCSCNILLVFLNVLENSEKFSCRAAIAVYQKIRNNKHGVSSNVLVCGFFEVFVCVCWLKGSLEF